MNDMLIYEREAWSQGRSVLGLDEAGRGPLAGPLVVAGVVFPKDYHNSSINDSKKLSEKQRNALYDTIREDASSFMIEIVSCEAIDRLNIYQATKQAMERIAKALGPHEVLTDAMPLNIAIPTISIIKGDQKSVSIAAASILAKVMRDSIMREYDEDYPVYGFVKNKGYPTREHLEALEKYGITPIHRKTYGPVARLAQMRFEI